MARSSELVETVIQCCIWPLKNFPAFAGADLLLLWKEGCPTFGSVKVQTSYLRILQGVTGAEANNCSDWSGT